MTHCAVISHGGLDPIQPFFSEMVRLGWKVEWLPLTPVEFRPNGVEVHSPLVARSIKTALGKSSYLCGIRRLRSRLRGINPDFVWAHYASSAGFLGSLAGVHPLVVSVYGSDLYGFGTTPWGAAVLKRTFSEADVIALWGSAMQGPVVTLGGAEERCLVGHSGLDLDLWRPPAEPLPADDEVRVICTRKLEQVYDIPTILRAIAKVRDRGRPIRAVFPAGGTLIFQMKSLADTLGVGEVVDFWDGYCQADLVELFRTHTVYVSASHWDGTSVSLLEALASGLFPVVSKIPANEEWVENGRNGYLFDAGDSAALADVLMDFHGPSHLVHEARVENRALIEERADRRTVLPRFLENIQSLAMTSSHNRMDRDRCRGQEG